MRHPTPDSSIIAAFWWSKSRADIACMLHTTPDHVKRVWAKAKDDGVLPDIDRPSHGFDPRHTALATALRIA